MTIQQEFTEDYGSTLYSVDNVVHKFQKIIDVSLYLKAGKHLFPFFSVVSVKDWKEKYF